MTTKMTKAQVCELIAMLRAVPPKRPLTYGVSLHVVRLQAWKLRTWLDAMDEPDLNIIWLRKQKAVPVNFVSSITLGEQSGLTSDAITGRLEMFINDAEPHVRQRFSLLHEFKHVLDWEDAHILHAKLGSGDPGRQKRQIELLCHEFAANVLMPTHLVKRLWYGLRDVTTTAAMFNVSAEAMTVRLEKLGLVGEPKPTPRVYFRCAGSLFPSSLVRGMDELAA